MLKGALHCHTTRSDGKGSPQEVIRLHKSLGYDFMALTDHNIYNYANYAPEVDITIIPGMERDHTLPGEGVTHCFHTVCLGHTRETGNGYEQDQAFERRCRIQDQVAYQPVLDDFHQKGQMTLYCHPEWSSTTAREFDRLKGNFAMEIWNSGCAMENDMDTNAAYWDELLMGGQRIFGAATDDGHSMYQHGNGWVMVNAKNDVESILAGLGQGAFYSSCGPEIYDFYVDDEKAVLECSPCLFAGFHFGLTPNRLTIDKEGRVTRAERKLPEHLSYVRGIVKDIQGRRAWTNPIFF